MRRCNSLIALIVAAAAAIPSIVHAQQRKLRVISVDSQPVVYAFVTFDGGNGQITDEKGEINVGGGKTKTYSVNVRRIGYEQWFGKLTFSDTSASLTVTLPRIAQALGEVRVSGRSNETVALQPFYDRWMMRQKGLLSASFIGPEEIEFRHPNRVTNMLNGLTGVSLVRNDKGDQVAMGMNGQCQMAILLDGTRVCPTMGCKADGNEQTGFLKGLTKPIVDDAHAVIIDHLIDAGSVAAIEVYARGGNMPASLSVSDASCGVIAFWTGARKQ
jgi:hypothetical protein